MSADRSSFLGVDRSQYRSSLPVEPGSTEAASTYSGRTDPRRATAAPVQGGASAPVEAPAETLDPLGAALEKFKSKEIEAARKKSAADLRYETAKEEAAKIEARYKSNPYYALARYAADKNRVMDEMLRAKGESVTENINAESMKSQATKALEADTKEREAGATAAATELRKTQEANNAARYLKEQGGPVDFPQQNDLFVPRKPTVDQIARGEDAGYDAVSSHDVPFQDAGTAEAARDYAKAELAAGRSRKTAALGRSGMTDEIAKRRSARDAEYAPFVKNYEQYFTPDEQAQIASGEVDPKVALQEGHKRQNIAVAQAVRDNKPVDYTKLERSAKGELEMARKHAAQELGINTQLDAFPPPEGSKAYPAYVAKFKSDIDEAQTAYDGWHKKVMESHPYADDPAYKALDAKQKAAWDAEYDAAQKK